MVQRSHEKNASAFAIAKPGVLKIGHLQHDRERLDHKDASHNEKHDFLTNHDGNDPQRAAKGKGANIAHKDLGGVGVKPQEGKSGTHQGSTEDRQFTGTRNEWQQKVF